MISGEGVVLRMTTATDRERWLELLEDPEQVRYGAPVFIRTPATVEELDARLVAAAEAYAAGEPTAFAIADVQAPDRFLGSIGWRRDAPEQLRICEIGYGVHPDARGRGVGRRAVRTMVRWLMLDEDGPRQVRVQLDHSVENPASCRVALGAGMEREGIRRAYLPLPDPEAPDGFRRHDVCLHGTTLEDLARPR